MPRLELRDAVHGFIVRDDLERAIIDSPVFQRLRRIRQLALATHVYPGAVHTRFEHSIGAMHLAGTIATSIGLPPDEVRLVRLAALLHDIGHGPFSHVSEPVLETLYAKDKVVLSEGEQIHEHIGHKIILTDKDLGHLLSERDRERIVGVLTATFGDSVLHEIVSGPLDADKQDYLLRDSYFCGVKYGVFDVDRLSGTLLVRQDSDDRYLAISEDGVHALEQFVLAKYYMTTQVYRHKIRLITDSMIGRGLQLGVATDAIPWLRDLFSYDGSLRYLDDYKTWTDDKLINEVLSERTPESNVKRIFGRLADRRLFKRVASYRLVEFEALLRDALAKLGKTDVEELERRIADYLKENRDDVIVKIFTIKSVREQSRNSEASIVVVTADGAREFEQLSALFRSIDEAVQEGYAEVYAPVTYRDENHKRKMRGQYQREIREIVTSLVSETLKKNEKEGKK